MFGREEEVFARRAKFPIGMGAEAEDITDRRGTATLIVRNAGFGCGSGRTEKGDFLLAVPVKKEKNSAPQAPARGREGTGKG